MAWIFSLSAECGVDENNAKYFAQHFEGIAWTLSNGRRCQCCADVFQDLEENWWCRVCPTNLSEVGIDTPEGAYSMTELGILLYQRLQSSPPFRYALVGVEVDEFRTYSELMEDLPDLSIPGLTLAIEVGRGLTASSFRPFRPGYIWQPYEGEVYNPLMVSPDLKNKLNALLVAS